MTKSTSHENCYHAKTKSARATCRRQALAAANKNRTDAQKILDDYYSNTSDNEEFAYSVVALASRTQHPLLLEASAGYYDNSLELEEMANLVYRAKFEL